MSEPEGIRGLEDIWQDLEGPGPSTPMGQPPPGGPWTRPGRTWRSGGASETRTGAELLQGCSGVTIRRFETLLALEDYFDPDWDFSYLIAPACQILESEFDRLLATPARTAVDPLIEAIRAGDSGESRAIVLEKWAAREIPTTIGIQSLLLLALRRGLEHRIASVQDLLGRLYHPSFLTLIADRELGRCFDLIRERFRNPACHGTRVFEEADYAEFVRHMVATERFSQWVERGPTLPGPAPGSGVFHHQISGSRLHSCG